MNRREIELHFQKLMMEDQGQFVCELCHLSERGARRLLSNGFDPFPCHKCKETFEQKGLVKQ